MHTYDTGTILMVASFGFLVLTVIVFLVSQKRIVDLRAKGLYPEKGEETDEDVVRLLRTGDKIMAIKCYRAVHQVGLKEAKDAVEQIRF